MSIEENKAVVRRLAEEVWNQGNMAAVDEIIADDFIAYDPNVPGGMLNKQSFRKWVQDVRVGFPDLHFTTEGLYADGDYITWRYSIEGTHLGAYMGIAPTGRRGKKITGVSLIRVSGGKTVESWQHWDGLGLLQELGVLPPMEQLLSAAAQRPPQGPTPGAPAPH